MKKNHFKQAAYLLGAVFVSFLILWETSGCDIGEDICTGQSGFTTPVDCETFPGESQTFNITDAAAGKTFNLNKFDKMLADSLVGFVGYQYTIGVGTQIARTGTDGQAMTFEECTALAMGSCLKMNIASQTKTITAAATMKLLEANVLNPDVAKVADYLPSDWTFTAWSRNLTFTQMMTHRSAMLSPNSDFDNTLSFSALKDYMAQDGQDSIKNVFRYRNANYALMRIVIPRLWQMLPDAPAELKSATEIDDKTSQTYYEKYIQDKFFAPAGIVGATLNFTDKDKDVLFYNSGLEEKGVDFDYDWRNITGGGGWYMSSNDLVKFMIAIQTNDAILSPQARDWMENPVTGNGFEIGYISESTVTGGQAYGHGGDLGTSLDPAKSKEMHGMLMKFPNNIFVAIMVNSNFPPNSTGLFSKTVNSYQACWE